MFFCHAAKMKYENFVWVTLVQLICFKELCSSTQSVPTEKSEAPTASNDTLPPVSLLNISAVTVKAEIEELLEIFHGGSNITNATADDLTNRSKVITEDLTELNVDSITTAGDQFTEYSFNDTFKTNYTVISEAIASQEDSAFRLESTGAIAAGVFLISAVVGYFSCVGYRRFMQKKYGNSQILAGEDVYDTRDLRYFEI